MSQRAFTARVLLLTQDDRDALWRTHRIFNERLRWVLRMVNKMKRGEPDPRYAEIFNSMKTSQAAPARIESHYERGLESKDEGLAGLEAAGRRPNQGRSAALRPESGPAGALEGVPPKALRGRVPTHPQP